VWLLGGITLDQLQAIADDETQPLEARGMAARHLERAKASATTGAYPHHCDADIYDGSPWWGASEESQSVWAERTHPLC
jgi:hypothetical protein